MKKEGRGLRGAFGIWLLTGMGSGLLYFPACSLTDIGENIIAGGLSFVEAYTEDLLASLFPPAEDIAGGQQE